MAPSAWNRLDWVCPLIVVGGVLTLVSVPAAIVFFVLWCCK